MNEPLINSSEIKNDILNKDNSLLEMKNKHYFSCEIKRNNLKNRISDLSIPIEEKLNGSLETDNINNVNLNINTLQYTKSNNLFISNNNKTNNFNNNVPVKLHVYDFKKKKNENLYLTFEAKL